MTVTEPKLIDADQLRRKRRSTPRKVNNRFRRSRNSGADTIPDNKFYITGEMFVYLMDQFEPKLTGFAQWAEENYQPGSTYNQLPIFIK